MISETDRTGQEMKKSHHFKLAQSCSRAEWEAMIPDADTVRETLIDMKDVETFEPAVLISMAQFLGRQVAVDKVTRIDFPQSKPARDFLRQTNFPRMVEWFSNQSLVWFSSADSLRYFGEGQNYPTDPMDNTRLFLENAPELCVFANLDKAGQKENAFWLFTSGWKSAQLNAFSKINFGDCGRMIHNRLAVETALMAINRPKADKALTLSAITGKDDGKFLEMVFWDNGAAMSEKSIVSTLVNKGPEHLQDLSKSALSLMTVTNAAVDLMHGEIAFESEKKIVTVSQAKEDSGGYAVEARDKVKSLTGLSGNLVAFKLPLPA